MDELVGFYSELRIGDIILVNSKSILNYGAQKVGTFKFFKEFNYTHVILYLSNGICIESTPKTGVDVFTIEELYSKFDKIYDSNFKVIRNIKVENDDKLRENIFKAAEYYYEQKYNSFFIAKKENKNKAYCSELIMNIYNKVGIRLKDKRPLWPIHIDDLLFKDDWINITDEYKSFFNSYKKRKDYPLIKISDIFKNFHKNNDAIKSISKSINRYKLSTNSFYYVLNPVKDIKKENIEEIKVSFDVGEIIDRMSTALGSLKELKIAINFYIEAYSEHSTLTEYDVKSRYKEDNNVKKVINRTNNDITNLLSLMKMINYNSTNFYNDVLLIVDNFDNLNRKAKNNCLKYLRIFEEDYPIIHNFDEQLKEVVLTINENRRILMKLDNEDLIKIVECYNDNLLITLGLIELHAKNKEKISNITKKTSIKRKIFNIINHQKIKKRKCQED